MNKKPAHLSGTAGQLVNQVGDTEETLYTGKAVYTIGDYVKKVQEQEKFPKVRGYNEEPQFNTSPPPTKQKKKLTFDEWLNTQEKEFKRYSGYYEYSGQFYELMEKAWKAAQENV